MNTLTQKLFTLASICLATPWFAISAEKPDVLFIAIDDMNDWTTLFDDDTPIQTPNLKRLAARGNFFNRAYCASPGCNPSRTAIMTGLRPTTSGVYSNAQAWRDKIPNEVSLPEYFAAEGGYVTRGAGKIYHHGQTGAEPKGRPSFQEFFKKLPIRGPWKNQNYNGYRIEDKTPLANLAFDWGLHNQKMIDVDMCEWVEARMEENHEAPLFLAAGIFNPHLPFYADAATFERYPKEKVKLPPMPEGDLEDVGQVGIRMSDKESFVYDQTTAAAPDSPKSLHRMVQCYQAATDYADQMVGRLLDKLDATGRADNTIIVLWSDHGYHLGDKECGVKFTLWEKANRVPFIIVAPGVTKPGSVCETPVSLVDIYPTLVELAGLPAKEDNDGLSLVPLLKNPNAEWTRPALMTEGPGNHAIRTRDFRYIRYHNDEEELYADDDPWNHTNLASDPKYADVLAEHRQHLPKTEVPGIPQRYQTIDENAWKQPKDRNVAEDAKSSDSKPMQSGFLENSATNENAFGLRGETLIANFEGDIGEWEKTGTAFDEGNRRNRVTGFLGKGYINTYLDNDKSLGTLTSPPFTIERDHIKFLVGGGNHPGKTGMVLLIDDTAVHTATGNSRKNNKGEEFLEWKSWDVSEFIGSEARIQILDQHEGGWGHILVDHIVQSDRGVVSAEPENSAAFSPPPKPGVELKDEWSTFPLYDQVDYDQSLRPQFHFTSRMGWLNDPNGMVYYDGEWHMLFQHYAKGNISGAKSWGNAVSKDLMNWEQLPHAINPYPKVDGSEGDHAIWSGSAVVDVHNALGKQTGDTKTLFALYSATSEKFFQGGAYSTDRGRTWTKIDEGKAVIPHQEGFSKGQRDPRIFYYAPGKFYVTIMMIGGPDRLVRLWKSTNLLDWEVIGDIPDKAAECIDMYHVAVDGDPDNRKWVIADAGTFYEIGDFDGKTWKGFGDKDQDENRLRFDYGDSYYAAQVFNQGPQGRVVHVGWLRSKQPGFRPFLEVNMPFTQQMSIPAEITLRTTAEGLRMYRNPVKEIEKLYHSTTELSDLTATEFNAKLVSLTPELIDLTLTFAPKGDFALNVRGLPIRYDSTTQEFVFINKERVEGEKAAWSREGPYRDNGIRRIPAPAVEGKVTLRALVDRVSLELFINDGQAAASFVVVPKASNRRIIVEGNDDLKVDSLVVNELQSAWGNGIAPVPVAEDAKSSEAKPVPSELLASSATEMLKPVEKPRNPGDKPNVVVIFIDDMGYGDIGPFGSTHPTPNLDRMAAEGMKLTEFYVSSSACTPSRSALLTGCYADRIGMGQSVVFPADERGLNPDEITIAEILKKGGYATGCFGKWHLGDQAEFMPLAQGFDVYEGIPYSNDMWVKGNPKHNYPPLPWMKQNKAVAHIPDAASQARITDAITDATVNFIVENQDQPFFAYVPHSAVHAPFMVTPKRLEAAGGDVMRALIGEIDQSTGRILDTLRQLGIYKNTLVLFTNDNGGAGKTSSGPLRGGKFGPKYEGHMRVSTLAWWPGKVPADSVTSEIAATIDLLPTIAKFAGQPTPSDRIIDGHDISDILLGKPGAKSPHETLYYENDGIRRGKWKLVHYRVKADWFTELYDLEADLGEQNDIADQYPDKVKELKAALDSHVAEIEANLRRAAFVENPKPLLADSEGVPTLVEFLGQPRTGAAPAVVKRKSTPLPAASPNLPPSRKIEITGKHLLLPIAPRKRPDGSDHIGNSFRIFVDGMMVHQFWANVARREEDIEFWSYLDMSEFIGKSATVKLIRGSREGADEALNRFESSDKIRSLKPFYTETGRPRFHFSQKVGWNNDVNGMVYADGLYHLSWQSNPVGNYWGNMYWGHAASRDLVHWEEWPHALRIGGEVAKGEPIHPAMALGQAFSGGAVVDEPNTLGLQKGDQKTLIAAYTSNPQGECLAYSTDGGRSYHHLNDHQPFIVQPHPTDPNWKKSWGRDPKLIWHEPTQKWIIVTYRMGDDPKKAIGRMAFYSSSDLKTWTEESLSDEVFHECPDLVELPVDGDPNNKKWLLFDATPKYQIGTFDGKKFTSEFEGTRQTIGGNLKAGQCFSNAPDGRAICMVWSRIKPADPQAPFNQGFTLPLELSLKTTKDGVRCYANPVKELESLRSGELASVENQSVEGEYRLPLKQPESSLEIELTLQYQKEAQPTRVTLQVGGNAIVYDVGKHLFPEARLTSFDPEDGKLDLRVFADSATVEVFGENGSVYFLQPRKVQGEIVKEVSIKVEGASATIESVTVHQLKSICHPSN